MAYRTRITPEGQAVIDSWDLSRQERIAVLTWLLSDLPADPDKHLTERIVPLDLWVCYLNVGQSPQRRLLMFAVRRLDHVEELHVVGGREEPDVSQN